MYNFAALLQTQGKFNEAEVYFRRALAGREAISGKTHVVTLECMDGLAGLLCAQGKFDEAEGLYRSEGAEEGEDVGGAVWWE